MPSPTLVQSHIGPPQTKDSPRLVLLGDQIEQSALPLYREALALTLARGKRALVVNGERSLDGWKGPKDLESWRSNIHLVHVSNSPLFPHVPQDPQYGGWHTTPLPGLISTIRSAATAASFDAIFIDDLSSLLYHSSAETYRLLRDLLLPSSTRTLPYVVGIYHADTLPPTSSPLLPIATLSSVHILVSSTPADAKRSAALAKGVEEHGPRPISSPTSASLTEALILMELKKRSGKMSQEIGRVTFDADGRVGVFHPRAPDTPVVSASPAVTDHIEPPSVTSSFNLTLTEEEREARDSTLLPYAKTSDESTQPLATFYYAPDDGDDFDEEDPDEDLDI